MISIFKSKDKSLDKVLDTSALIDGRIIGLLETGFLEGKLIVPRFVLEELQLIADNSNRQKREKGKKGLKVLEDLKKISSITIDPKESQEIKEEKRVDSKLVLYCKENESKLVTTDHNLANVAKVQDVKVLSINELLYSLRFRIFVGDSFWIQIKHKGEESSQGVGYLEDGTLVIVDNALEHVGRIKKVRVRSIIQKESGRLIFTKIDKSDQEDT